MLNLLSNAGSKIALSSSANDTPRDIRQIPGGCLEVDPLSSISIRLPDGRALSAGEILNSTSALDVPQNSYQLLKELSLSIRRQNWRFTHREERCVERYENSNLPWCDRITNLEEALEIAGAYLSEYYRSIGVDWKVPSSRPFLIGEMGANGSCDLLARQYAISPQIAKVTVYDTLVAVTAHELVHASCFREVALTEHQSSQQSSRPNIKCLGWLTPGRNPRWQGSLFEESTATVNEFGCYEALGYRSLLMPKVVSIAREGLSAEQSRCIEILLPVLEQLGSMYQRYGGKLREENDLCDLNTPSSIDLKLPDLRSQSADGRMLQTSEYGLELAALLLLSPELYPQVPPSFSPTQLRADLTLAHCTGERERVIERFKGTFGQEVWTLMSKMRLPDKYEVPDAGPPLRPRHCLSLFAVASLLPPSDRPKLRQTILHLWRSCL